MFEFLTDAVNSSLGETERIRADKQARQDKDDAIHMKVLETLANAEDVDPEIRSAAVTGMLTPRKPGTSLLSKWFGETTQHPSYGIMSSLIGQKGKDLYQSPEAMASAKAAGQRSGTIRGAMGGFSQGMLENAGEWPNEDEIRKVGMGASGAPQSANRRETMQGKTAEGEDVAGYFDPASGSFIDLAGNERPDVVTWTKGGAPRPTSAGGAGGGIKRTERMGAAQWNATYGAKYGMAPGGAQFISVPMVNGEPVGPPAPTLYSPPPAYVGSPIYTPGGDIAQARRYGGFDIAPAPGGGRAADPSANAANARATLDQVRKDADSSMTRIGGIVNARKLAAARDDAAKKYGYPDYAALQAAAGEAAQGIAASTPPPPAPHVQTPASGGIDVGAVLKFMQQR